MKKMHYSVLLKESIDGLNIKDGGTYVDCTLGYAGHSKVILEKIKRENYLPSMKMKMRLSILKKHFHQLVITLLFLRKTFQT